MGVTTDRTDPRLGRGVDEAPVDQHDVYLVLSDEERAKGFVRPYRDAYSHVTCPAWPADQYSREAIRRYAVTTMGRALSETYARQPSFYGATYCSHCKMHRPVGADGEFVWFEDDGSEGPKVGT